MDKHSKSEHFLKCGLTEYQMVEMKIVPLRQLLLEMGVLPKTERDIMSYRRMVRSRWYAQRHRDRCNDACRVLLAQKEELEKEKEELEKEIEFYERS